MFDLFMKTIQDEVSSEDRELIKDPTAPVEPKTPAEVQKFMLTSYKEMKEIVGQQALTSGKGRGRLAGSAWSGVSVAAERICPSRGEVSVEPFSGRSTRTCRFPAPKRRGRSAVAAKGRSGRSRGRRGRRPNRRAGPRRLARPGRGGLARSRSEGPRGRPWVAGCRAE